MTGESQIRRASNPSSSTWRPRISDTSGNQTAKKEFRRAYVLSFLIVVLSASWVANLGADWLQLTVFGTSALFALYLTRSARMSVATVRSASLLAISVLAISSIRSGAPQPADILFFASFLIAVLSAEATRRNLNVTLSAFVHVNYHLAIISLLLFPFIFVAPNLLAPVPDVFQKFFDDEIGGNRRFVTLFGLSYFATNSGIVDIWRNQSIFWEPGMFGFIAVLSLALADTLGWAWRKRLVFIVATLSTFAPGAYALLVIFFGLKAVGSTRKGVLRPSLVLVVFGVGAAASVPLLRQIVILLFDRDIYSDPSIYIRSTDFWLPYVVALKSPFLGYGSIEPYQDAMQIAIERRMEGITNSVGSYFYRYGYFWAFGFLYWIIASFSRADRSLGVIPFLLLLGVMYEPIGFSVLFLYLVFLARSSHRTPGKAEKRR